MYFPHYFLRFSDAFFKGGLWKCLYTLILLLIPHIAIYHYLYLYTHIANIGPGLATAQGHMVVCVSVDGNDYLLEARSPSANSM